MRIKTILITILILLVMMISSCTSKDMEWNGTIEEKDGVMIIKNPKEPMYESEILSLEEELSIRGISKNGDFIFAEVYAIAVDGDGKIFICDRKEGNIKKFNQHGELLKIIGGRGQGPGEMSDPGKICISNKNELVVVDFQNRCLLFFSNEGKYMRTLKSEGMILSGATIDSKGNIISHTLRIRPPGYELIKFDSDLNPLFKIGSMPYHNMGSFNPFVPTYTCAVAKNDNIIYGYSNKYELMVFNAKGKIVKKISKEYDPVKVTELEKEEEIKKAPSYIRFDFSETHSAFQGIKLDDEDRIFVKTWKKEKNKRGYYYDIFDAKGRYIAEVFLEWTPSILKNHKLYSVTEDEYGFHVIKRYKVTWNY